MDFPKMSPKEYAASRSRRTGTIVQPQNIYYYIRRGDLSLEACECCGRLVVDVKLADEFFDGREQK
jgi:hypothetical protein